MNEELFPDGRQQPLGQSAGRQKDPLPPLHLNNNNDADDGDDEDNAADDCDEADNTDGDGDKADNTEADEEAADGDEAGDGSDNDACDELDSDDIADPGFIDSFLGYCQHARITQDKRLDNLDHCLTGVAKKSYRVETKFVGDFTDWNALRPNLPTALALTSHPTPGAQRPRPCTAGMASSAATSLTVVVSTSSRSASRQCILSPESCLLATDITPATTA